MSRPALGPLSPNVPKPSQITGPPKRWKKTSKELPPATRLPPPGAHRTPTKTCAEAASVVNQMSMDVSPTTAGRVALSYLALGSAQSTSNGQDMKLKHALFDAEVRCMNERRACQQACTQIAGLREQLEMSREATAQIEAINASLGETISTRLMDARALRAEKESAVAALQQQLDGKDAFIADTTSHREQLETLLRKSNSEAAAAAARDAATRAELEEKLAQQSKTHRAAVARLQSTLGKLNEALNRSAADRLLEVEEIRVEKDNKIASLEQQLQGKTHSEAEAIAQCERLEELLQQKESETPTEVARVTALCTELQEKLVRQSESHQEVFAQLQHLLSESASARQEEQVVHQMALKRLKEEGCRERELLTCAAEDEKVNALEAAEAKRIVDLEALRAQMDHEWRAKAAAAAAAAVAAKESELACAIDAALDTAVDAKQVMQVIDKLERDLHHAREMARQASHERDTHAAALEAMRGEMNTLLKLHHRTSHEKFDDDALSSPLMKARTRAKAHQRAVRKARKEIEGSRLLVAQETSLRMEAEKASKADRELVAKLQDRNKLNLRLFFDAAQGRAMALRKVIGLAKDAATSAAEASRRTKDGRAAEALRFAAKYLRAHASVTADVIDAEESMSKSLLGSLEEIDQADV